MVVDCAMRTGLEIVLRLLISRLGFAHGSFASRRRFDAQCPLGGPPPSIMRGHCLR